MESEENNQVPAESFESSSSGPRPRRPRVNLDDLPIEVLYALLDILRAQEFDPDWPRRDPNSDNGRLYRRMSR